MPPKTNALRLLDQHGVPYDVREYDVDLDDLSATTVAAKIGMPAEQVFKTICVRGDRHGVALAVVPGHAAIDFKELARLSDNRSVEMVPLKEVQALTGYLRGAVTALACKKPYPVFADETITLYERISISCGQRGMQAIVAPDDYVRVTGATVGLFAL
jgi:Cys-tRNA(Pro)/Cys-tRNA(Cys) deacylase